MKSARGRGQSLVELALISPILIILAMLAWDGGSVLREQVVLQQAVRDGARVAASAYNPGASQMLVSDAVLASAADLPNLSNTPGYLAISYPDALSVQVRLRYAHALVTPVLRQVWGGAQGIVTLSASATFYLPTQTPVPATIAPSTPIPTATPTPTVTPTLVPPTSSATPTPTATVTPTPGTQQCNRKVHIAEPLDNNTGWYVALQLTGSSTIGATWTIGETVGGTINVSIYSGNPFSAESNPTPRNWQPSQTSIVAGSANSNQATSVSATTPQAEAPGTYTVFIYKQGAALTQPSDLTLTYTSGNCT